MCNFELPLAQAAWPELKEIEKHIYFLHLKYALRNASRRFRTLPGNYQLNRMFLIHLVHFFSTNQSFYAFGHSCHFGFFFFR